MNFKNFFRKSLQEKKPVPVPRIRGKAIQREDQSWAWEMEITIGDLEEGITMNYPANGPGFNSKDEAISDLKEHANGAMNVIVKDVFKTEPVGMIDLIKNQYVEKL